MTKHIFVLSAGRTGTKFLAEYFNANYDNVLALHEPKPSRILRIYSNAYVSGKVSRQRMATVLRHKRRKIRQGITSDHYIESNPFLFGFVDILQQVWPNPTVIHIIRDPRDSVRSAHNHGSYRGMKLLATKLVPYWSANATKILGMTKSISSIGFFAAQWVLINRTLSKGGPAHADYFQLRFEDIFDESHSGLSHLCGILKLEVAERTETISTSQKINQGRLNLMGGWRSWTRNQCLELNRICSPMMQKYGYGMEEEWLEMVTSST